MSSKCTICLSSFREPVCIPCGHVYCTRCLADHVNSPSSEETASFCPTCRAPFTTVTPDLTYLPRKYHQYIVPSVRRVYLEATGNDASLRKKLTRAEDKIVMLEESQDSLITECEQYKRALAITEMRETEALNRIQALTLKLNRLKHQAKSDMEWATQEVEEATQSKMKTKNKYEDLKQKYNDLKQLFHKQTIRYNEVLEVVNITKSPSSPKGTCAADACRLADATTISTGPTDDHETSDTEHFSITSTAFDNVYDVSKREIRPLPHRSRRSRNSLRELCDDSPGSPCGSKRPRLSEPIPLLSPTDDH